ncbi:hypothetical protein [Jeotgalibacillus soli]|uniref:GGDEF domain-containing protein n=1 Tax=Jeotgalibacillus soli TaxID=889306 RepID=A0A0C2VLN6_9BACL|nr:hypothetical protein [Jeotgalibacillus soli]KIL49842.1 hypothetical protein KP78_13100 [Jeotgalibacillus soli]
MENRIRLGVIGPLWVREQMENCLTMFPSIEPVFRFSDQLLDAAVFTNELDREVDAYLYSGRLPYLVAKSQIPNELPAFYIPLKGAGLYQALYRLRRKQSFERISLDGIAPAYVEKARKSLDESFSFTVFEGPVTLDNVDDILSFHEAQHSAGDTVIITSMKIIAELLTEKGIPNEWLKPAEEDIIVILERLLLATDQRRERESQVVFGTIQIDSYSKLVKQLASAHQVQKRNAQLYRLLLDYVEQMDGFLTSISGDEYLFITNRGTFERVTEGYKWMPILDEVKRVLNMRISIGVGFGRSAIEAGTHSRIALFQAQEYGGSSCFIVREDRSVFGPVEVAAPVTYPLTVTDQHLIKQAEKAGMNAAHFEKIIALIKRKKVNQFTAHELAQILGITIRSSHRIILSWVDAEIIKIIGTEKLSARGRPRQVFMLDFGKELV